MKRLDRLATRLRPRCDALYGMRADEALAGIMHVCSRYAQIGIRTTRPHWSERDTLLIAYADQVRADDEAPLATLHKFLVTSGLQQVFRVLHLLPFYPASSDDGFSVIDYLQVDPDVGTWADVDSLGGDFDLMFDLVLNHASRHSFWFECYLRGIEPYSQFFIEADPADDHSRVVRPRALPLLTPVETSCGLRHVWTTFSEDQVDLNYREPKVLVEMIDVLLSYLRHGARIIRLDAVAYAWKSPGTKCIHLPQVHTLVKVLRDVVDELAPGTLLLTETNVPHAENTGYWGDSDEAHLIYNFSLPPLILDSLLTGDATYLNQWIAGLAAPLPGTAYLNFTASHDGIGVRPVEELLPAERVEKLIDAVLERGGLVSQRAGADGKRSPYELNISYFDALGDAAGTRPKLQVRRFLASQAIMLALRGIPAVYFHSLLGTPNDCEGVTHTGRARSINRRKFKWTELQSLTRPRSAARQLLNEYRRLLAIRLEQPAFHPDTLQTAFDFKNSSLLGTLRDNPARDRSILMIANVSDRAQEVDLSRYCVSVTANELIADTPRDLWTGQMSLLPYQVVWLPVKASRHCRAIA